MMSPITATRIPAAIFLTSPRSVPVSIWWRSGKPSAPRMVDAMLSVNSCRSRSIEANWTSPDEKMSLPP